MKSLLERIEAGRLAFPTYYYFHETQAHSVDGIHLIESVGKKKYFVVRDSDGACVCSREIQAIAPGAHGLSAISFVTEGFGARKPVAPNKKLDGSDDADGRQKNRRVEIIMKKG